MTKEEFELWYGQQLFAAWGLRSEPCDCGEPECKGWHMVGGLVGQTVYPERVRA